MRGKVFDTFERPFICNDNEAALWFYCRTFDSDFIKNITSISNLIEEQTFPIGFTRNSSKGETNKVWKNWGKLRKDDEFFNKKGWLHAHLHDVNNGFNNLDLSVAQLKIRSFRYLHPANHFPIWAVMAEKWF